MRKLNRKSEILNTKQEKQLLFSSHNGSENSNNSATQCIVSHRCPVRPDGIQEKERYTSAGRLGVRFGSFDTKRGKTMSYTDWMSQLPVELHTISLFKLAIPGSHDSMSYDLDINSRIIEPERLRRFSRIYCLRKIIHTWAATQEVCITEQLNAGARYFDLRIARKPNDTNPTRLFFHHGLYTQTDVETVLREINTWAEKHPKEIIILSLSHFEGFDQKISGHLHNHLITFIINLFGNKLLPKTNSPTLKSCWNQGKNIIVSYDNAHFQQPLLWRKITYYYGNSMDRAVITAKLCQALEKEKSFNYFFVCGLNPTLPHNTGILLYILRICDNFTNVVRRGLPKLLRWVNQQYDKTPMNIVASDVVTRDGFVATIVKLNLKRAKGQ